MDTVKEFKEGMSYIAVGIVFLTALIWAASAKSEMIETNFVVVKDNQEPQVNTLTDIKPKEPEKSYDTDRAVSYESPQPCR